MATQKQTAARNKQRRTGFLNNAKTNGVTGAEVFAAELEFWNMYGDWRGMADLIGNSVYTDADQFRKMVSECLDHTWTWSDKAKAFKRNKNAKAPEGVDVSFPANERGIYDAAVAKFRDLADRGMSFRGYQKVKAADDRTDVEKQQAALSKIVAAAYKAACKNDLSIEEFANLMRLHKVADDIQGNAA